MIFSRLVRGSKSFGPNMQLFHRTVADVIEAGAMILRASTDGNTAR